MIPRFGESVDYGRRYKARPGAYVILERGGTLLLTQQAEPVPELQLPGGGIDPGESPVPALHREVLEETGHRMVLHRRLGAFRRFTYMPEYDLWAEKICHIYLGRPTTRQGPPMEQGHTVVWMPAHEAAERLDGSGDRAFVRALL